MSVCVDSFQYLTGRKISTKNFYNFYCIVKITNHSSLFIFHLFHQVSLTPFTVVARKHKKTIHCTK